MIANLTSLAIMVAAVLFALSLPFGDSETARSLRRGAAFAFVMAFVPSVILCLFAPLVAGAKSPFGSVQSFLAICGALAILGVLALAAYGYLDVRSHMRSRQPKPHGEGGHYAKRRSAAHTDEPKDEDE